MFYKPWHALIPSFLLPDNIVIDPDTEYLIGYTSNWLEKAGLDLNEHFLLGRPLVFIYFFKSSTTPGIPMKDRSFLMLPIGQLLATFQ